MLFMPVFHVRICLPAVTDLDERDGARIIECGEKSCAAFFGGGDPVGKFLFGCAHEARAASKVV